MSCPRLPALLMCLGSLGAAPQDLGLFTHAADVGSPSAPGRTLYDPEKQTWTVTAAGENIWGTADRFHYVHQEAVGDIEMTASAEWLTAGGHPHKKAGLMLRASIAADAPHASAMVHADGLISLQYRRTAGGPTEEVKAAAKGPAAIRLARHGDVISMEISRAGGPFQPAAALTIALPSALLAGVAVCSHEDNATQTARISQVALREWGVVASDRRVIESTLEIVNLNSGERRIVRRALEHFEAPNWTRDGKTLVYNGGGKIYRIPVAGGDPQWIQTGNVRVNNDHGLSPDGARMVVSGSVPGGQSKIYTLPALGGELRPITPQSPSYWHGWSPDGGTLAYCASRNGEYDIYTIPVEGGEERRLTTEKGLDDGPEYSPDGRFIYFNSVRSGLMRIWRMGADGSGPHMISQGPPSADWFAHPSPDGNWIAYISYDAAVEGHPPHKDVRIRVARADGSEPRTLVTLFGGQGTINVPSWSPDSREFAFVSYRLVPGR